MAASRPWHKKPEVVLPLLMLIVGILSIPFVSQFFSERLPANTVTTTISTTSTVPTTVTTIIPTTAATMIPMTVTSISVSTASAASTSPSSTLMIRVDSHDGWFVTPEGQAYAIVPRNETTTLDFVLINVGNSSLEILGATAELVYPNGTVPEFFNLVNPGFQLAPGENRSITFHYWPGLPRFPGSLRGELRLTVVCWSDSVQWSKVEIVPLSYV